MSRWDCEPVDLDTLMTVEQVCERWPVLKPHALREAMKRGQLRHIQSGRQKLVTRAALEAYLTSIEQGVVPCRPASLNSTDNGSAGKPERQTFIATGTTPEAEESGAAALVAKTLKKPSAN